MAVSLLIDTDTASDDAVAMKQPAKKGDPDGILSQLFSTEPVP